MRKDEFSAKLHEQTVGARVSPKLRRQALDAARGKEEKTVKKKISMTLVFALVGVLAASVAFAAAMNRAGVLDFVSRYSQVYIPEDAADYMQTEQQVIELDEMTLTVRELYYDGRTARITVDAAPSDEKTLLMGVDSWIGDPWQDLITLVWADADESDTRSIAQAFADYGYERAYNVNIYCTEEQTGLTPSGSVDFVLGEDGVLTTFAEWDFDGDQAQRPITMTVALSVYEAGEDGMPVSTGEVSRYSTPMTLTEITRENSDAAQAYVNDEPVLYESIGVQIDRLLIEVKPLELYATIEYTVVDAELYAATDDGLWFEFIDPQSTATEAWEQRLSGGLTASGGSGSKDGVHFRQSQTLGLNELRGVYTLRAYSAWEKTRYETHDIAMHEATAGELAAAQAEWEPEAVPEETPRPDPVNEESNG